METSSTVATLSPDAVGQYYRAIRQAYAIGGLDAVLRDYGALLAAAALAVLMVLLLLAVVLLPRQRKIVRKRVVRVTRHDTPVEAAQTVEPREVETGETAAGPEPRAAILSRRLRSVLVPIVSGLVVLVAFIATYIVTGSNGYCGQSCHVDDPFVVAALENHHADCIDCHESGPVSGSITRVRMAFAWMGSEDAVDAAAAVVGPQRCFGCHRGVLRETVDAVNGMRVSHKEALSSGRTCSDCHNDVGHREGRSFAGGMAKCTTCHDGKTARSECVLCHPGGSPLEAKRSMGDDGTAFAYPTVQAANRDCSKCHGTTNKKCLDCHGGFLLPHSEGFRSGGHGRVAAFDGRERCYKCHSILWCGDGRCHNSFTPHDPDTWLVGHRKGTSETCGSCHMAWDEQGNWCDVCH